MYTYLCRKKLEVVVSGIGGKEKFAEAFGFHLSISSNISLVNMYGFGN